MKKKKQKKKHLVIDFENLHVHQYRFSRTMIFRMVQTEEERKGRVCVFDIADCGTGEVYSYFALANYFPVHQ